MIARTAALLLAAATWRMRPARGAWARAMHAEAAYCDTPPARLGWAWGCAIARVKLALQPAALLYAAALSVGVALMATYEWRQDETVATVAVLAVIAMLLGALRPAHAVLSGIAVGAVVAAVTGFEAATGIRPAYETHPQSLAGCLTWTVLLLPAVPSAWLGARAMRLLRPLPAS